MSEQARNRPIQAKPQATDTLLPLLAAEAVRTSASSNNVANVDTDKNKSLIDSFGRVHTNLRISVTDRCNIRCFYCMPEHGVQFLQRSKLLTFEEIARVVRLAVPMGIRKLRLTGGEPLVRRDLPRLVSLLNHIDGIQDIGLTTNGLLLTEQASELYNAGLRRLNVSLDALDPDVFRQTTRRDGFERVLEGLQAAKSAGFEHIKINAVAIKGLTESQLIPFAEMARESKMIVRFIEFMPLDADGKWTSDRVFTEQEILQVVQSEYGPLVPVSSVDDFSGPATDYTFADGVGRIGVIPSVTKPFCRQCNRFRLTADGKLRNCLFSLEETDIRSLLRTSDLPTEEADQQIQTAMLSCIQAKQAGHQINSTDFIQPDRPMHSIGG